MAEVALPSAEDRAMLRDAVRGVLQQHWWNTAQPRQPGQSDDAAAVWKQLCAQGLATLGTDRGEGALREILLVMEELGRAACPAPMLAAALVTIALWSRCHGDAAVASLLRSMHQGVRRSASLSALAILTAPPVR